MGNMWTAGTMVRCQSAAEHWQIVNIFYEMFLLQVRLNLVKYGKTDACLQPPWRPPLRCATILALMPV